VCDGLTLNVNLADGVNRIFYPAVVLKVGGLGSIGTSAGGRYEDNECKGVSRKVHIKHTVA
jgi:hypothetical protein